MHTDKYINNDIDNNNNTLYMYIYIHIHIYIYIYIYTHIPATDAGREPHGRRSEPRCPPSRGPRSPRRPGRFGGILYIGYMYIHIFLSLSHLASATVTVHASLRASRRKTRTGGVNNKY